MVGTYVSNIYDFRLIVEVKGHVYGENKYTNSQCLLGNRA